MLAFKLSVLEISLKQQKVRELQKWWWWGGGGGGREITLGYWVYMYSRISGQGTGQVSHHTLGKGKGAKHCELEGQSQPSGDNQRNKNIFSL